MKLIYIFFFYGAAADKVAETKWYLCKLSGVVATAGGPVRRERRRCDLKTGLGLASEFQSFRLYEEVKAD